MEEASVLHTQVQDTSNGSSVLQRKFIFYLCMQKTGLLHFNINFICILSISLA